VGRLGLLPAPSIAIGQALLSSAVTQGAVVGGACHPGPAASLRFAARNEVSARFAGRLLVAAQDANQAYGPSGKVAACDQRFSGQFIRRSPTAVRNRRAKADPSAAFLSSVLNAEGSKVSRSSDCLAGGTNKTNNV